MCRRSRMRAMGSSSLRRQCARCDYQRDDGEHTREHHGDPTERLDLADRQQLQHQSATDRLRSNVADDALWITRSSRPKHCRYSARAHTSGCIAGVAVPSPGRRARLSPAVRRKLFIPCSREIEDPPCVSGNPSVPADGQGWSCGLAGGSRPRWEKVFWSV